MNLFERDDRRDIGAGLASPSEEEDEDAKGDDDEEEDCTEDVSCRSITSLYFGFLLLRVRVERGILL